MNGVSEPRTLDTPSSTIASSSGYVLSGRQSSKPSRQTSDSLVTAPEAALERSSLKRIGPTGTPLMPTNHSSPGMLSGASDGTGALGGVLKACVKAPANVPAPVSEPTSAMRVTSSSASKSRGKSSAAGGGAAGAGTGRATGAAAAGAGAAGRAKGAAAA